jgi:hypothetical protein
MARGLVESTADFLATGMDEYFSGLHDLDNNEKHWYVYRNPSFPPAFMIPKISFGTD